jgi:hypothetical protein
MGERYCEAFVKIVDLAMARGHKSIKDLPGCLEMQIGEWWVAVNGRPEPVQCSRGMDVEPYHAVVFRGDWPAGVLTPAGGTMVAGAEDELIAALEGGNG